MYDIDKQIEKYTIYFACVIVCFLLYVFLMLCFRRGDNHTNGTIQQVKQDASTAGNEINQSIDQVRQTEKQLSGAVERIRDSRNTVENMSRDVDDFRKEIDDCLRLNRDAQKILAEFGTGNKIAAKEKP